MKQKLTEDEKYMKQAIKLAKTKRITVDGDMHNPTVQIVNEANEVEAVE